MVIKRMVSVYSSDITLKYCFLITLKRKYVESREEKETNGSGRGTPQIKVVQKRYLETYRLSPIFLLLS